LRPKRTWLKRKPFGGRALPRPARGVYSAPPDSLAAFERGSGRDRDRKDPEEEKKGEWKGRERKSRKGRKER